jgi:hypothetical protein
MKSKQRVTLIALGSATLLSYWIVSLWALSPDFEPITGFHHPLPSWIFTLSTFLLFVDLSLWSVLILAWFNPPLALPTGVRWRMSAFKYIAAAAFSQLILWYKVLLTFVLDVALPPIELWFVALALAWMTTPFATLGFMYVGVRLGSWLDRRR